MLHRGGRLAETTWMKEAQQESGANGSLTLLRVSVVGDSPTTKPSKLPRIVEWACRVADKGPAFLSRKENLQDIDKSLKQLSCCALKD